MWDYLAGNGIILPLVNVIPMFVLWEKGFGSENKELLYSHGGSGRKEVGTGGGIGNRK